MKTIFIILLVLIFSGCTETKMNNIKAKIMAEDYCSKHDGLFTYSYWFNSLDIVCNNGRTYRDLNKNIMDNYYNSKISNKIKQ